MEQRSGGGTTVGNKNNGNVARDLQAQAQEQLEDFRERFGDVSERVTDFIKERPGTSLLIAVGAGFLIGRMLRS